MTVAELIEQLKEFNPELKVWMAEDPEGNELRPFLEIGLGEVEEVEDYVVVLWPGYYVQN